ncbi:hypothetical protein [Pseudophaeobacter sp.]
MAKNSSAREKLEAELAALDAKEAEDTLANQLAQTKATLERVISERDRANLEVSRLSQIIAEDRKLKERDSILQRRQAGPGTRHQMLREAAARASRAYSAVVQKGIREGTHDPATGAPYDKATNPKPKDFTDPKTPMSKGDLAELFPQLGESEGAA